jgi:A/G-specific adenine glycosylase
MRLTDPVLDWYARSARDLPWRRPDAGAWAVLVSEVMLQQTPVNRVLPAYQAWLARWPSPPDLAASSPADAVRQWGRLGYPRRALRLHAAAVAITDRFGGAVPSEVPDLLSLPGVGAYTARAVAAFAFGQRQPVVDTNVRRVLARAVAGVAEAGPPSVTRDHAAVAALLPDDQARAARLSAALMELGALVCTARAPDCAACPIATACAWQRAGRPAHRGPSRAAQRYQGTDRQVRGLLLAVLRDAASPASRTRLDTVWPDAEQRDRALRSLLADGLVEARSGERFALAGDSW